MNGAIVSESLDDCEGTHNMKTISFGRTLGLLFGLIGYLIHINSLIVAA
jgi:hypothetical protein